MGDALGSTSSTTNQREINNKITMAAAVPALGPGGPAGPPSKEGNWQTTKGSSQISLKGFNEKIYIWWKQSFTYGESQTLCSVGQIGVGRSPPGAGPEQGSSPEPMGGKWHLRGRET
jgi:hypothetical protein